MNMSHHRQQFEWSSGLCDCGNNARTCFITCCLPCITFGQIVEVLDEGRSSLEHLRKAAYMGLSSNALAGFPNSGKSKAGDSDTEVVPDTIFDDASIHINAENASVEKQKTHSEDPFNIYKLLTKNKENNHKEFNLEDSLKYPPGFTPINDNVNSEGQSNKFTGERLNNIQEEVLKDKFNEDAAESTCSGHFKKSNISRTGGSILQVMEEMVKVGHTMGYNMEGCIKNIEEIIKSQGVNDVNR
ncbi:nucleotide-binding alpha-beta plait domain-containing protein [Tanacetum coccineum]